jgi:phytol kinase
MLLDRFFDNPLAQDLVATALTFGLALGWLRLVDAVAHRGLLEPRLSRKIIHIGTGPLVVLCWLLFSDAPHARFLAALVPLAITAQFLAVGLGLVRDPAAVQAMTRTGNAREILRGPLIYGLVFVGCTLLFWRTSPVGIVALMLLCGGDGLADIIGRRLGRRKLPINPAKSWAGSLAMFLGGLILALALAGLFNVLGLFAPPLVFPAAAGSIALIALVAAIVEALPLGDYDNLTLTALAVVLGLVLL